MLVAVGLTRTDLSSLDHTQVVLSSASKLSVYSESNVCSLSAILERAVKPSNAPIGEVPAAEKLTISRSKEEFELKFKGKSLKSPGSFVIVKPAGSAKIMLNSIHRAGPKGNVGAEYRGTIVVFAHGDQLRVALVLDLDNYLAGVLKSEIPASYHVEAIKAQAVAARTYGLHPRIDHNSDNVNVCDSYLCCQYFGGLTSASDNVHQQAIHATAGQVLLYQGKPLLALFSSNAGGHTENYENCFSDARTNQFPPEPRPYLKGVPETIDGHELRLYDEKELRAFHNSSAPDTVDAWSPHFKWTVNLTGDDLESHMHATVQSMLDDPLRAPFVVAPPSAKFGHLESINVIKRGVSGCAIELIAKTSSGDWKFKKELIIRDLFKTPTKNLARLKSARFYIDHSYDKLKLLSTLKISGLGWGHGVGLQQTGAQGWAKRGFSYRKILAHYFQGGTIDKV